MRLSRILAVLAVAAQVSACASHQPAWDANATITISGKATANLTPQEGQKQMMIRAARAAVDHGHRYFRLAGISSANAPLAPGADIQIRLLDRKRTGEDWDAYLLLESARN